MAAFSVNLIGCVFATAIFRPVFPYHVHVGLVRRTSGVDPLGDLVDVPTNGGTLFCERLVICCVRIASIAILRRHAPYLPIFAKSSSKSLGTSFVVARPKSRTNSSFIQPLIASIMHYMLEFLLATLNEVCYNVHEPVGRLVRSRRNPGRCGRLPGVSAPHFSCLKATSAAQNNGNTLLCCLWSALPGVQGSHC